MVSLVHTRTKRTRPANSAANRKLAEEWEALLAKHSKSLEKGGKAKGLMKVQVLETESVTLEAAQVQTRARKKQLPTTQKSGPGGTLPSHDPLAQEKRELKARVGQAFNKGGLVYLTDDELAEQKTGAHRRR